MRNRLITAAFVLGLTEQPENGNRWNLPSALSPQDPKVGKEAIAVTKTLIATLAAALLFLIVSAPVLAHHGNAEFNTEKTVTVKGTVTEWFWANPHCFLKFDEQTDAGETRHWVVETSNPPDMINNGWSKYSLKPGDQVTVTMHQVKDTKKPIGRVVKVAFADGKVLGTGGGGNTVSGPSKTEGYDK